MHKISNWQHVLIQIGLRLVGNFSDWERGKPIELEIGLEWLFSE